MHAAREKRFKVIPLKQVKSEGKKILTPEQLKAGISITKLLMYYPLDVGLQYKRFGEGHELPLSHPTIDKQGWLRAFFWVHERNLTIYIVDLFWKKTNKVATADRHRINDRIRRLKALLAAGGDPWKSGQ